MIAGGGEKMTLRLVAQYADACNIMDSPEMAAHKFAVLEKHCADVDRDHDTINRTVTTLALIADTDENVRDLLPPNLQFAYPGDVASYGLIGTVHTLAKRIAAFEAAGVQELILNFADPSAEQVAQFAEQFLQTADGRSPGVGTPSASTTT